MKIVLDANVIYGNWLLKCPNIALIEKYIQLNEIEIIVPEVIILEVVNLYKRELEKHILSIKKMKLPAAETAGYHQEKIIIYIIPQTPFYKGDSRNPHSRDCGVLKI